MERGIYARYRFSNAKVAEEYLGIARTYILKSHPGAARLQTGNNGMEVELEVQEFLDDPSSFKHEGGHAIKINLHQEEEKGERA